MQIIKEEYREEYEKRVREIKNVFLNAYSDYYNLVHIEPYLEKYKPRTVTEIIDLLPARNFMNSIVRTMQEEFILIICSLEDNYDNSHSHSNSNSLKRLSERLKNCYLINYDLYSKEIREMPERDKKIKDVRDKAIAHFDVDCKVDKLFMVDVKNRLDILKNCFNSYLFGDMVTYKIDDNSIGKIATESRIGVQQLFYGFVNMICNR